MKTTSKTAEVVAQLLTEDLQPVGSVTYSRRLTGYALLEDGVMFGFVTEDGEAYLRASAATAAQFHAMGSAKHPQMPYWTIPAAAAADLAHLCELAYEAADMAHIAILFGIDDEAAVIDATGGTGSQAVLAA